MPIRIIYDHGWFDWDFCIVFRGGEKENSLLKVNYLNRTQFHKMNEWTIQFFWIIMYWKDAISPKQFYKTQKYTRHTIGFPVNSHAIIKLMKHLFRVVENVCHENMVNNFWLRRKICSHISWTVMMKITTPKHLT